MKYVLNQKWFALGEDFPIVDEKGREAFRVDAGLADTFRSGSSAFMPGERISFRDREDTELAFISVKLVSGGAAFEIYHGDELQSIVRRDNFNPQTCKFIGESSAPDDLHAEGNLTGREYTFKREGKAVGRVSKSLFAKTGTYGVEVGRGEDELLLLASAVVIDLCCQHRQAG